MGKILLASLVILLGVGYGGYRYFYAPRIVSKSVNTVLSCADSDGYDIYVKGFTNFKRDEPGESSFYESPDTCEPHPTEGTVLREGSCDGTIYTEVRVTCGFGYTCNDGACVKS